MNREYKAFSSTSKSFHVEYYSKALNSISVKLQTFLWMSNLFLWRKFNKLFLNQMEWTWMNTPPESSILTQTLHFNLVWIYYIFLRICNSWLWMFVPFASFIWLQNFFFADVYQRKKKKRKTFFERPKRECLLLVLLKLFRWTFLCCCQIFPPLLMGPSCY